MEPDGIILTNSSLIVTQMVFCNVNVDAVACLLDLQTASQGSDEPVSAKRLIWFWDNLLLAKPVQFIILALNSEVKVKLNKV